MEDGIRNDGQWMIDEDKNERLVILCFNTKRYNRQAIPHSLKTSASFSLS